MLRERLQLWTLQMLHSTRNFHFFFLIFVFHYFKDKKSNLNKKLKLSEREWVDGWGWRGRKMLPDVKETKNILLIPWLLRTSSKSTVYVYVCFVSVLLCLLQGIIIWNSTVPSKWLEMYLLFDINSLPPASRLRALDRHEGMKDSCKKHFLFMRNLFLL